MKPIVIVGAGITGCVIGYELARRGKKVILVEKNSQVGGLARTFRYGDFSFDVGPHRFYTQKERVSGFIHDILKDDSRIISRNSGVYFLGRYYSWPLRPTILFSLPLYVAVKSAWELLLITLKGRNRAPNNFEDYILVNYGPTLYNIFFKEYTQKFLGLPTREIHFEWAKEAMKRAVIDERIASRHLLDILKLTFKFRPLEMLFTYPEKGMSVFCERMTELLKESGGEILTDVSITGIRHSPGKIEELLLDGRQIEPENVIWTAPLTEICRLLGLPSTGIDYLNLILYNIELKNSPKIHYQWSYYGDKKIIFGRVTEHPLFSKTMAPEGRSSLCVEVNPHRHDPAWDRPETLIEKVKNDLIKVGLIDRASDIKNIHIERIRDAYPVYTIRYSRDLKSVRAGLSRFSNLILAGRTGLFWYNNMDDCIENGLEVADNILKGEG